MACLFAFEEPREVEKHISYVVQKVAAAEKLVCFEIVELAQTRKRNESTNLSLSDSDRLRWCFHLDRAHTSEHFPWS